MLLIKNVQFKEKNVDILIEGNKISRIADHIEANAEKVIDGSGKAVCPGFVNMHTHAAMSLFRGYADDMELQPWLTEKIWPHEAKMTDEMYYWGTKLACLEMIKTGTTCFNDMYMNLPMVAKATDEMGLRAFLSSLVMDPTLRVDARRTAEIIETDQRALEGCSNRITMTIAPHAIYTVPEPALREAARQAKQRHLLIHMHSSETRQEVADCLKEHGMEPLRWLDSIGFLDENVILAHSLWLTDAEIQIMADRGVKAVHNPNSNLKLASGYCFKYHEMKDKGVCIGLGTDGDSSSNNLDMIDAMKTASLIGKAWRFDPTAVPAKEMYYCATRNAGCMLGLPIGKVEEGFLADLILLDLNTTAFTPNFHFTSNLVYAANGYCVDTVICDGRVLMEARHVDGEEEILQKAREMADRLFA